ncbi:MAG: SMI1/KNR4 family protein [Thainema sp.]
MSDLLDSLNHILRWMEKNEQYMCLMPGLSTSEIAEKSRGLPFSLPLEMYELYQWRNGWNICCPELCRTLDCMSFFPLEEAVAEYHSSLDEYRRYGVIWYRQWFPIFQVDATWIFVSCAEKQLDSSPIFSYDFKDHADIRPKVTYLNLTSMMQTIAECWDRGAYYIAESPYEPGAYLVKKNFELFEQIRYKNNPDVDQLRDILIPEEEFYSKRFYNKNAWWDGT